ncbi:MAG: hypothetical protein PF569_00335 [Candidatus Woesearchaeota archaeon]|jgi:hypothetical protein|nr:hypothetical protein [Candidatus Woesearchaeota archaeon]
MSLTRKERYELSLKARKEGEAKEGVSYPKEVHPEYCSAPKGTPTLFRPMTFNSELDPKEGTDHRFFYKSFLKDDEGKFFPFKRGFDAWYKHPIYKIVKKVGKYEYDKEAKSRKYDNQGCELLLDITHNGDIENTMTSGWGPSKTLLMNVVDRMDDWCRENKHSKVLTNKYELDEENDRVRTDYGIKVSQYDDMFQEAEKQLGSVVDFDFLTIKFKKPREISGGKKQYYETMLAEMAKPYIGEKYGEDYANAIIEDYDTDNEMSYEMYDFDSMDLYKPSSIGLFLSKKSQFIKAVDKTYGTDFFNELTALADAEKRESGEEVEEKKATEPTTKKASETSEDKSSDTPEEKVSTTSTRTTRGSRTSVKEEAKGFNPKDLDPEEFKGLSKLKAEELAKIIGVNDDGTLQFVEGCTLEPCDKPDCKMNFPVDFQTCVFCSAEYT